MSRTRLGILVSFAVALTLAAVLSCRNRDETQQAQTPAGEKVYASNKNWVETKG